MLAGGWVLLICIAPLLWLFWPALARWDTVVFSNDGPLGMIGDPVCAFPGATFAIWDDRNWLGGAASPHLVMSTSPQVWLVPLAVGAGLVLYFRRRGRCWNDSTRLAVSGLCFFTAAVGALCLGCTWLTGARPDFNPVLGAAWAVVLQSAIVLFGAAFLFLEPPEQPNT